MTINGRSKSVPNLEAKTQQNDAPSQNLPTEIDPDILEENERIAAEFNEFNNQGGIVRDCFTRRDISHAPAPTKQTKKFKISEK